MLCRKVKYSDKNPYPLKAMLCIPNFKWYTARDRKPGKNFILYEKALGKLDKEANTVVQTIEIMCPLV